jgi:hypothetical protein
MTLFNPAQPPTQTSVGQPAFSNASTTTEFSLTTETVTIASDRNSTKNRRGLILFNDGTANILFNYGSTISSTNFTAELLPGGYFEDTAGWQAAVVARSSVNSVGNLNVTEIVFI